MLLLKFLKKCFIEKLLRRYLPQFEGLYDKFAETFPVFVCAFATLAMGT